MSATSTDLQPIVDGRGATILGPRNVPVELAALPRTEPITVRQAS